MSDNQPRAILPPFKKAPLPPLPSMMAALGPGVIFMALAQGSGELIWWPYIIAKYGLSFLFLLLPACLLQFPVTYEIGRFDLCFNFQFLFQAAQKGPDARRAKSLRAEAYLRSTLERADRAQRRRWIFFSGLATAGRSACLSR